MLLSFTWISRFFNSKSLSTLWIVICRTLSIKNSWASVFTSSSLEHFLFVNIFLCWWPSASHLFVSLNCLYRLSSCTYCLMIDVLPSLNSTKDFLNLLQLKVLFISRFRNLLLSYSKRSFIHVLAYHSFVLLPMHFSSSRVVEVTLQKI